MFSLTRQEQMIIVAIVAALLVGATVKQWRTQHARTGETGRVERTGLDIQR